MKRKLLLIALLLIASIALFAACGGSGSNKEPTAEPTDVPTATPVATPTPTPTPEPTPTPTPTPVPERGTYDLFAEYGIGDPMTADADGLICGDTWPDNTGRTDTCWSGILGTGFDASDPDAEGSVREIVETTLSNGEKGYAIRFANDGTTNGYVGAGNYISNVQEFLAAGCKYKFTVVAKATHSAKFLSGEVTEELRPYSVFCTADALGISNAVNVEPKDEWQTIEYVFTVADNFDPEAIAIFTVLSDISSPFMWQGFEVLIESVTLYEIVE